MEREIACGTGQQFASGRYWSPMHQSVVSAIVFISDCG
jgi:hypothetical protein